MTRVRPQRGRIATRALSNVFLGIAIGLIAYYLITDIESSLGRAALRSELRELGAVAAQRPGVLRTRDGDSSAPVLDFAGWTSQDERFWRSAPEGDVIGRLIIQRVGLDSPIVKGADRNTLKKGPGWIPTTSVPGPVGNCAISGHRTTYLAPFRHLGKLSKGDKIELYTPYRRYTYEVSRSRVVRPRQVEVLAPTEDSILTLTACHPPYSASYRLLVQSKLTDVRRLKGADPVGKS